jgi:hypothetical protein
MNKGDKNSEKVPFTANFAAALTSTDHRSSAKLAPIGEVCQWDDHPYRRASKSCHFGRQRICPSNRKLSERVDVALLMTESQNFLWIPILSDQKLHRFYRREANRRELRPCRARSAQYRGEIYNC